MIIIFKIDIYVCLLARPEQDSIKGQPLKCSCLDTHLLASSTTVAKINSVDLSLTITWQSSASGDLINCMKESP